MATQRTSRHHDDARHRSARSATQEQLSFTVRVALDMAWTMAQEVEHREHPAARFTTTALLLALCDLARTDACPGSRTLAMLREQLTGHWRDVATARGQYLAGLRYQEAPVCETSRMSEAGLRTLRLARLLGDDAGAAQVRVRHVLAALLLTPPLPEPTGAHAVLRSLGVSADALRERVPT